MTTQEHAAPKGNDLAQSTQDIGYDPRVARKLFDAAIESTSKFHNHTRRPAENSRALTGPLLEAVALSLRELDNYVFRNPASVRSYDRVGRAVLSIVAINYAELQVMASERSTYRKIKRQMYDLTWTLRDLVDSSGWAAYGMVLADWGRHWPFKNTERPHDGDRTEQFASRGICVADVATSVSLQARLAHERGLPLESWESYAVSVHDDKLIAELGTQSELRSHCLRQTPEWLSMNPTSHHQLMVKLGLYDNCPDTVRETGASLVVGWTGTIGELIDASKAINR